MKYWWWVCLALLLLCGFQKYKAGQQSERIAQLEQEKAQVDTVYVTDTLRLAAVRRHTDSLPLPDSVRSIILGERHACDVVIVTCEKRVAIRDSIIHEQRKPKPLKHLPWLIGGILIGKFLIH